MSFRIKGLSPEPFAPLYGLPDAELAARGILRYQVDKSPGFPDRIEMRDAAPGETVLLLNHVCQSANTPYRAAHAIFVREGATQAYDEVGVVPDVLRRRLLSLRAYDASGMMLDADVVEGADIEPTILRLFDNAAISYLHAHNAKRGCYAGLVLRS